MASGSSEARARAAAAAARANAERLRKLREQEAELRRQQAAAQRRAEEARKAGERTKTAAARQEAAKLQAQLEKVAEKIEKVEKEIVKVSPALASGVQGQAKVVASALRGLGKEPVTAQTLTSEQANAASSRIRDFMVANKDNEAAQRAFLATPEVQDALELLGRAVGSTERNRLDEGSANGRKAVVDNLARGAEATSSRGGALALAKPFARGVPEGDLNGSLGPTLQSSMSGHPPSGAAFASALSHALGSEGKPVAARSAASVVEGAVRGATKSFVTASDKVTQNEQELAKLKGEWTAAKLTPEEIATRTAAFQTAHAADTAALEQAAALQVSTLRGADYSKAWAKDGKGPVLEASLLDRLGQTAAGRAHIVQEKTRFDLTGESPIGDYLEERFGTKSPTQVDKELQSKALAPAPAGGAAPVGGTAAPVDAAPAEAAPPTAQEMIQQSSLPDPLKSMFSVLGYVGGLYKKAAEEIQNGANFAADTAATAVQSAVTHTLGDTALAQTINANIEFEAGVAKGVVGAAAGLLSLQGAALDGSLALGLVDAGKKAVEYAHDPGKLVTDGKQLIEREWEEAEKNPADYLGQLTGRIAVEVGIGVATGGAGTAARAVTKVGSAASKVATTVTRRGTTTGAKHVAEDLATPDVGSASKGAAGVKGEQGGVEAPEPTVAGTGKKKARDADKTPGTKPSTAEELFDENGKYRPDEARVDDIAKDATYLKDNLGDSQVRQVMDKLAGAYAQLLKTRAEAKAAVAKGAHLDSTWPKLDAAEFDYQAAASEVRSLASDHRRIAKESAERAPKSAPVAKTAAPVGTGAPKIADLFDENGWFRLGEKNGGPAARHLRNELDNPQAKEALQELADSARGMDDASRTLSMAQARGIYPEAELAGFDLAERRLADALARVNSLSKSLRTSPEGGVKKVSDPAADALRRGQDRAEWGHKLADTKSGFDRYKPDTGAPTHAEVIRASKLTEREALDLEGTPEYTRFRKLLTTQVQSSRNVSVLGALERQATESASFFEKRFKTSKDPDDRLAANEAGTLAHQIRAARTAEEARFTEANTSLGATDLKRVHADQAQRRAFDAAPSRTGAEVASEMSRGGARSSDAMRNVVGDEKFLTVQQGLYRYHTMSNKMFYNPVRYGKHDLPREQVTQKLGRLADAEQRLGSSVMTSLARKGIRVRVSEVQGFDGGPYRVWFNSRDKVIEVRSERINGGNEVPTPANAHLMPDAWDSPQSIDAFYRAALEADGRG